jgi:hypothetical protein
MSTRITTHNLKLDEHNHVEKPLLAQLDWLDWGITPFIQDLLTGKMRVTALLNDTEAVSL